MKFGLQHNEWRYEDWEVYLILLSLMLTSVEYGNLIRDHCGHKLCCFQAINKKIELNVVLSPSSNISENTRIIFLSVYLSLRF